MKKLVLLAIAACWQSHAFSQNDFRPGFVVTNAGDTLKGQVSYREDREAYRECAFKADAGGFPKNYAPSEISAYGFFADKFFESTFIATEPGQPVFLEVLVKGYVSLYKSHQDFWIRKDGDTLRQLKNETQYFYIGEQKHSRKSNEYLSVLNVLLFDCVGIRNKLKKVSLQKRPLANLVEHYNRCKGAASIVPKSDKPWARAQVGLATGANFSKIEFDIAKGSGYDHLAGPFEDSRSSMFGISLLVSFPRTHERFAFTGNVLYFKSAYRHLKQQVASSSIRTTNDVTIELQQIKIPLGIQYNLSKKNFIPYLNAGVSTTFRAGSKSSWIVETQYGGSIDTDRREAVRISGTELGFWGGLGAMAAFPKGPNLFAEVRYEQTNGVVNERDSGFYLLSKITNVQLILGIRLK